MTFSPLMVTFDLRCPKARSHHSIDIPPWERSCPLLMHLSAIKRPLPGDLAPPLGPRVSRFSRVPSSSAVRDPTTSLPHPLSSLCFVSVTSHPHAHSPLRQKVGFVQNSRASCGSVTWGRRPQTPARPSRASRPITASGAGPASVPRAPSPGGRH